MAPGGSVTHWFKGLEGGDSAAASAIWHRYYPQLVRMARDKLRGVPRGMADEEDVALSAMNRFVAAARRGRFPDLADRNDLWRLLLRITVCKAIDLARHEKRERRCPRREAGKPAVDWPDGRRDG
jgi:DNA-directed RNA polymerase specialized sigma24 family protein